MPPIIVEQWGNQGPRVVLVHGSLGVGKAAFAEQKPLADKYQLCVVYRRGYGDNPPIDRVDVMQDARDVVELLGAGAHLVGTSVGGVVSLIAAGLNPAAVKSLTVIEPPVFPLARDIPAVREVNDDLIRHWKSCDPTNLKVFAEGFLAALKYNLPLPDPLPEELKKSIANLVTEQPWKLDVPIGLVGDAQFPKAVVWGDWSEAFSAMSARLATLIGAEARPFKNVGHAVQRVGAEFNSFLEQQFLRT